MKRNITLNIEKLDKGILVNEQEEARKSTVCSVEIEAVNTRESSHSLEYYLKGLGKRFDDCMPNNSSLKITIEFDVNG